MYNFLILTRSLYFHICAFHVYEPFRMQIRRWRQIKSVPHLLFLNKTEKKTQVKTEAREQPSACHRNGCVASHVL